MQDPELQLGTCVHPETAEAWKAHHLPPAASAAVIDTTVPFRKGFSFPKEKSGLKCSFVKDNGKAFFDSGGNLHVTFKNH